MAKANKPKVSKSKTNKSETDKTKVSKSKSKNDVGDELMKKFVDNMAESYKEDVKFVMEEYDIDENEAKEVVYLMDEHDLDFDEAYDCWGSGDDYEDWKVDNEIVS